MLYTVASTAESEGLSLGCVRRSRERGYAVGGARSGAEADIVACEGGGHEQRFDLGRPRHLLDPSRVRLCRAFGVGRGRRAWAACRGRRGCLARRCGLGGSFVNLIKIEEGDGYDRWGRIVR
jgi:hypothetical protein